MATLCSDVGMTTGISCFIHTKELFSLINQKDLFYVSRICYTNIILFFCVGTRVVNHVQNYINFVLLKLLKCRTSTEKNKHGLAKRKPTTNNFMIKRKFFILIGVFNYFCNPFEFERSKKKKNIRKTSHPKNCIHTNLATKLFKCFEVQ